MKDRLKALRKELGLTQQELASSIGIVQNTYAKYEIGMRTPIESIINNICKTWKVNETWLRTGEGDMFAWDDNCADSDDFLAKNGLNIKLKPIVDAYFELPQKAQEAFCAFLSELKSHRSEEKEEFLAKAKAALMAEVEREIRAEIAREIEGKGRTDTKNET